MPVKDIIKDGDAKRRLRLGKIRLGEKKKSQKTGKEYPVATPYFVLRDAPGVSEIYGEKPVQLTVLLLDPSDWSAWYKCYGKSAGLKCLGDGEHVIYRKDDEGHIVVRDGLVVPKLLTEEFYDDGFKRFREERISRGKPMDCPGYSGCGPDGEGFRWKHCRACRLTGTLNVMVKGVNRMGRYSITTGSYNSVMNIDGTLDEAVEMFGTFVGVEFYLRLVEAETTFYKDGKPAKKKTHVLQLEVTPEFIELWMEQVRRERIKQLRGEVPALPAPADVPADAEVPTDTSIDVPDDEDDEIFDGELVEPENGDAPEFTCANCGKPLIEYTSPDSGKTYTVSALIDTAANQGLAPMCGECLRERKNKAEGGAK